MGGEAQGEHGVGGGEVALEIGEVQAAGQAQPVAEPRLFRPGRQRQAGIARARDHQHRLRMLGPEARHHAHGDVEALAHGGQAGSGDHEGVRGQAQPGPALRARRGRIDRQGKMVGQVQAGPAGQASRAGRTQ